MSHDDATRVTARMHIEQAQARGWFLVALGAIGCLVAVASLLVGVMSAQLALVALVAIAVLSYGVAQLRIAARASRALLGQPHPAGDL